MIRKLGDYYLNMPVRETLDLKELSPEEYEMFESSGVRLIFKGEKIYHGRGIDFAGAVWKTILGSTEGMIFRIALQTITTDKDTAERIFISAYDFLFGEMGVWSEHESAWSYFWNETGGNVILELVNSGISYIPQICFTSTLIRQQAREKFEEIKKIYKTI